IQALAHSPSKLHAFIDELQIGFAAIHDTLSATYFVNGDSLPLVAQSQSQSQSHSGDNDID
ncbi:MAG TPA: alpha-E domain-containing protein, partial [Halomonas sp.]|nr:alpha-E domain-containing protein [Halomonas sp.]